MNLKKQNGVVLFIALVVLVALSLAGIAMHRSVDASMGIVGNLSFRQSAVYGADKAVADAIVWLEQQRNTPILNDDQPLEGYRARTALTERDWRKPAEWVNSKAAGTDIMGNQLEYVIERLCSGEGVYTAPNARPSNPNDVGCILYEAPTGAAAGNSLSAGAFQFEPPPMLGFRITARARGPKNATSIVQTYYLIPM